MNKNDIFNKRSMKQYQLPNNSIVILPSGKEVIFLEMDGMYAHWNQDGELRIGNYEEFEKVGDKYKVIK